MCKILSVVNINKGNRLLAWKFIAGAVSEMTRMDRSGFGLMTYFPESDSIFVEKWLRTKDVFKHNIRAVAPEIQKAFKESVDGECAYQTIGAGEGIESTVCLHARLATCGVSIDNTHPFYRQDKGVALVHNGIISNHRTFDKRLSSCDSEAILSSYIENNVMEKPENISEVFAEIDGSMACIVYGNDGEQAYVDVFRNNSSDLQVAYVDKLGTCVIATTPAIIRRGCKSIRSKRSGIHALKPDYLVRFNAATGETLLVHKAAYTRYSKGWDALDLNSWKDKKQTPGAVFPPATESKTTPLSESTPLITY